jgi:hypothetical protein
MREKLGSSLSAVEREELDRTLNSARKNLPVGEQNAAWSQGQAMSIDRLLEFALND